MGVMKGDDKMGMNDSRGVLTVNVIRAMGLEVRELRARTWLCAPAVIGQCASAS